MEQSNKSKRIQLQLNNRSDYPTVQDDNCQCYSEWNLHFEIRVIYQGAIHGCFLSSSVLFSAKSYKLELSEELNFVIVMWFECERPRDAGKKTTGNDMNVLFFCCYTINVTAWTCNCWKSLFRHAVRPPPTLFSFPPYNWNLQCKMLIWIHPNVKAYFPYRFF